LAGIRANDVPEETVKKSSSKAKGKKMGGHRSPLVRFSEAPGMGDDDDELYFEDDDYDLPAPKKSGKSKKNSRPPPPKSKSKLADDLEDFDDLMDEEEDDVPEVDTRIRSTMALEKHWYPDSIECVHFLLFFLLY
jgi:hypothetical protein